MNVLDYLNDENRDWFFRLEPVSFRVEEVKCVAYLARAPVLDLDLAIVEIGGDFVSYGCLMDSSLKGYDGKLGEDLVKDLSRLVMDEDREVGNLRLLSKMIDFSLSQATCRL